MNGDRFFVALFLLGGLLVTALLLGPIALGATVMLDLPPVPPRVTP